MVLMLTHRRRSMLEADEVWQLDQGCLQRIDEVKP